MKVLNRPLVRYSFLVVLVACGVDAEAPSAPAPGGRALAVALVPHRGDSPLDAQIRKRQEKVRQASTRNRIAHLERLGSLFVAKARRSNDPGFYTLAEQCALAIEAERPEDPSALLLRGHVLHSLHDFKAAEVIARKLVAARGGFLDHGLLGDVLLDRGELEAALASYQKMLDLKPCLQSYVRAAQVSLLRGNTENARELLALASRAGSPRDTDAHAWALTQLARVEHQTQRPKDAMDAVATALRVQPDYAPALLMKARLKWDRGEKDLALQLFRKAAERNPLPEYHWHLIEALAGSGRHGEAAVVDRYLRGKGAAEDPRTLALYLVSRGDVTTGLRLAKAELDQRADLYTLDVHAWALFKSGDIEAAWRDMQRALAHGTKDARLFYHAGSIALARTAREDAAKWLRRARSLEQMLLPSERRDLARQLANL